MKIRNLLATVAAAGVLFAPVVASANTRPAGAVPVVSSATAQIGARQSVGVAQKQNLVGIPFFVLFAAIGGLTALIVVVTKGNRSRGAS